MLRKLIYYDPDLKIENYDPDLKKRSKIHYIETEKRYIVGLSG
jgi:hypothetical protein